MDDRASSAEEGWLRARPKDDASWGSRGRSAVGAYGNGHPCRRARKAVCWRREVEHAGVAGGTVIEMKTRGISVRIRIRIRLASSHLCIVVASVVMLHQEGDDGTGGGANVNFEFVAGEQRRRDAGGGGPQVPLRARVVMAKFAVETESGRAGVGSPDTWRPRATRKRSMVRVRALCRLHGGRGVRAIWRHDG